jgi:hypothetical protein
VPSKEQLVAVKMMCQVCHPQILVANLRGFHPLLLGTFNLGNHHLSVVVPLLKQLCIVQTLNPFHHRATVTIDFRTAMLMRFKIKTHHKCPCLVQVWVKL